MCHAHLLAPSRLHTGGYPIVQIGADVLVRVWAADTQVQPLHLLEVAPTDELFAPAERHTDPNRVHHSLVKQLIAISLIANTSMAVSAVSCFRCKNAYFGSVAGLFGAWRCPNHVFDALNLTFRLNLGR